MNNNVLFVRDEKMSASEDENQENIWDDSLLIKAYERAINAAKEKVASLNSLENGETKLEPKQAPAVNLKGKKHDKPSHSETKKVWAAGMHCRAVYSEDGLEYEGLIKNADYEKGTCRVVYIGYNNEEEVQLSQLKPSRGPSCRKTQKMQSLQEQSSMSYDQEKQNEPLQFPEQEMIPPPPPPHVMAHFPKDESDALSAMLMAWYMSGYHTGYYQGLTKAKSNLNGFKP